MTMTEAQLKQINIIMDKQKRPNSPKQRGTPMLRQSSNLRNGLSQENEDEEVKPKQSAPIQCMIGEYTMEQLKEMHPQQNTFEFDNIKVTSKFDSGNLARMEPAESPNHYNLWISTDSLPYFKNTGFRTWFYYGVSGAKWNQTLTFTMKNLNHQGKLFANGLRPVYRLGMNGKWKRTQGKMQWMSTSEGTVLTFEHTFTGNEKDLTYFAFTYPFSYTECINFFDQASKKIQKNLSEEVYFHREILGFSLEERVLELITITSIDGMLDEKEDHIEGLFPEIPEEHKERFSSERARKFDKPTVFLSARVHPGEIQSSYVLNGIVDFLVSKSESAKILRSLYNFKIIPLLNPDGVYRGYFRLDTYDHNLNRFYLNPDPKYQPTIYAAKEAIVQQHKNGKLSIYIDLHGHAVKQGCFIFGNALKGEEQAQNMLLAKLISLNSLNFDFAECSFAEKLMSVKDRGCGLSREGSGRVGIFKATGLINCYTLECNFQTGRRINHLPPKIRRDNGEIEPEIPITDQNSKFYSDGKTPNYVIEIFEDIGRAVCLALLDLNNKNPITRMLSSQYKTAENLKKDLCIQFGLLPSNILREMKQEQQQKRQSQSANQRLQQQKGMKKTRNSNQQNQPKSLDLKTPLSSQINKKFIRESDTKIIPPTLQRIQENCQNSLVEGTQLEEIKERVPKQKDSKDKATAKEVKELPKISKEEENKLRQQKSDILQKIKKKPLQLKSASLKESAHVKQLEALLNSEENEKPSELVPVSEYKEEKSDPSSNQGSSENNENCRKRRNNGQKHKSQTSKTSKVRQPITISEPEYSQQDSFGYFHSNQINEYKQAMDTNIPTYNVVNLDLAAQFSMNQQNHKNKQGAKFNLPQVSGPIATQNLFAQSTISSNQPLYELSSNGHKLVPKLMEKQQQRKSISSSQASNSFSSRKTQFVDSSGRSKNNMDMARRTQDVKLNYNVEIKNEKIKKKINLGDYQVLGGNYMMKETKLSEIINNGMGKEQGVQRAKYDMNIWTKFKKHSYTGNLGASAAAAE